MPWLIGLRRLFQTFLRRRRWRDGYIRRGDVHDTIVIDPGAEHREGFFPSSVRQSGPFGATPFLASCDRKIVVIPTFGVVSSPISEDSFSEEPDGDP